MLDFAPEAYSRSEPRAAKCLRANWRLDAGVLHEHSKIEGIEGGPSLEAPSPRLGQHTEEVLMGLGYSKPQIAWLRGEDAI